MRYFFKFCDCVHIKNICFHKPSSRLAGQTFIITQILIYAEEVGPTFVVLLVPPWLGKRPSPARHQQLKLLRHSSRVLTENHPGTLSWLSRGHPRSPPAPGSRQKPTQKSISLNTKPLYYCQRNLSPGDVIVCFRTNKLWPLKYSWLYPPGGMTYLSINLILGGTQGGGGPPLIRVKP